MAKLKTLVAGIPHVVEELSFLVLGPIGPFFCASFFLAVRLGPKKIIFFSSLDQLVPHNLAGSILSTTHNKAPIDSNIATIIFPIMSNINGDIARKPDPPGDDESVYRNIDYHFDTTGSMSTMTDPPPSVSLLGKRCMSTSIPRNIPMLFTINEAGCSTNMSSNDPPMMDNEHHSHIILSW